MSWRPLLTGELAAMADDAVHAIAEALENPAGSWNLLSSLGGCGTPDMALFYGYLGDAERADGLLDQALDFLATTPMNAGLYSGFTGIAWTAEHLGRVFGEAGDDMNEEIDETLLTVLATPWTGDYDLMSGLVGFGVYALERVPRPTAIRCLEAVVDGLCETAVSLGEGTTWFTSPDWLPPRNRQENPNGYYNLGVAHGVPAVIGLLAGACRLGIREEKARPLLEGAVRWVVSQRLSARPGACYPGTVAPGVEPQPSRLAWCYGDPGVAVTLLYAARTLERKDWEHAALEIATHAAKTAPEHAGVRDGGLCHGAFGLAHMYNRIYQAVGDELFADAARLWYRLGLDMRRPEGGIAGFEAWHLLPNMQMGWTVDPGLLTGAVGIGLSLLAGLTSVEPQWDRLLMTAVAPKHATDESQ